ncbi:MAG TPA: response regulator [Gemmatimonadaceae bacterium]|nr:response regulator [Gemmatimonadaceae bacterium]
MPRAEWRVLIADDEPAARRGVRQLLAGHAGYTVVGECRNGGELLAALDAAQPDVVFLDIQMPGASGFDVIARRTPERMPAVIFLTAYDQHALRAFEAQAFDYLVKPVSEARFAATIRRLTKHLALNRSGEPEPVVTVDTPRGSLVLALCEIDWIEAADNYVRVWVGERNWLLRESLSALEDRLHAHGFARAHRQAMVRIGAIRQLVQAKSGRTAVAVLNSGARVPISRRRRAELNRRLRR